MHDFIAQLVRYATMYVVRKIIFWADQFISTTIKYESDLVQCTGCKEYLRYSVLVKTRRSEHCPKCSGKLVIPQEIVENYNNKDKDTF